MFRTSLVFFRLPRGVFRAYPEHFEFKLNLRLAIFFVQDPDALQGGST